MMNLNRLYYFFVFCKKRSVLQAAKALSISQPALSAQLKQFEEDRGGDIFFKAGRTLELTEKGKTTYDYCRKIFDLCDQMETSRSGSEKSGREKLSLGVSDQIDRPFSAHLVSLFFGKKSPPERPMIHLNSDSHEKLVSDLKDKTYDLVLTNQPSHHEEVRILGSMNMPVFLTVSNNYKAFPGRSQSTQTLSISRMLHYFSRELVLPSRKLRLRMETDQYLEKLGVPVQAIFESAFLAPIVRAVLDGLGPGFIPLPYIASELNEKRVRIFGPKKGLWQHSIWLLTRQHVHSQALIEEFAEIFESIGQQAIPLEMAR